MKFIPLRRVVVILLIIFQHLLCFGQTDGSDKNTIDSLFSLIENDETEHITGEELLSIANKYFRSNAKLSKAYGELALQSPLALENENFKAKALVDHGYNLNKQGEKESALQYLSEGKSLAEKIDDKRLLIRAMNSLGIYYNDRGNNVVSSDYYLKCLSLASEIKDTLGMLRPYVNLSGIYMDQDRPEKTIEYALTGLKLARDSKNQLGEAYLLNNIAIAYNATGEIDEAKKYLLQAISLTRKLGEPEAIARNHSNLCDIYTQLEEYQTAEKHCQSADSILSRLDAPRSQMLFALTYGDYFIATDQTSKALKQADKALKLGEGAALSIHLGDVYDLYHMAYEKQGRYKESLEMYQKYWEIKHGSLSNKRVAEINQSESNYLALAEENKLLSQEAEVNALKLDSFRSNRQRNIAIGSVFFLLTMVAFIYRNLRIKKKLNDELKVKNAEIETQKSIIDQALKEKETLLKEIHHRVKNNLQIISSLLNLQSKKISDESTLASIKEGKNRVEAMSLIHQNLYQTDNLTTLHMQDYFKQLVNNLSRSLRIPNKTITHEVEANNVHLDIDTAIPIGLIVNELVSNSYEHGFEDKKSGHIGIALQETDDHDSYTLSVTDTGKGIPTDLNLKKASSLGLKLVHTLGVRQLKGQLNFDSESGNKIVLTFPKPVVKNDQLN